jgi:hypothetical protein
MHMAGLGQFVTLIMPLTVDPMAVILRWKRDLVPFGLGPRSSPFL